MKPIDDRWDSLWSKQISCWVLFYANKTITARYVKESSFPLPALCQKATRMKEVWWAFFMWTPQKPI